MKKWLEECVPEVLRTWLAQTTSPMLVTMPEGKIVWCNKSFENMVGYTIEEIDYSNIGWGGLTVDHTDLKIDLELANKLEEGDRKEYSLFKSYKTKSGNIVPVVIHVLRYPQTGKFEFCLVSITPTSNQISSISEQIETVRSDMIRLVEAVSMYSQKTSQEGFLDKYIKLYDKRPIPIILATLAISSLLFGDRVVQLYKSLSNGFKTEPEVIYVREK